MKPIFNLIVLLIIGLIFPASAELVVIANKDMDTEGLTRKKVIDIYMGRNSVFANGKIAIPLDQSVDSTARSQFYEKLVGKNMSEINAYWARLLFSGRARPPHVIKREEEIVDTITESSSVIGYVDSSQLTDKVKVIIRVE